MKKILGRIEKIARKIGAVDVALVFARSRVARFNDVAHKADAAVERAENQADKLRAQGRTSRAARQDRIAARKRRRAANARVRREVWLGRVKSLAQRKHELKTHKDDLERELARWQRQHKPRVRGKKIVGGSVDERLQFALLLAAARCAAGDRPNRYSMPGDFSAEYLIHGEPAGYRTDCSQFGSSVAWACGVPDPNDSGFTSGWTGSLEQEGTPCSVEYARKHPWCAVIYGPPGRTFHVEWTVGDGTDRTVGHGSPPIDFGVIDLLGNGQFRCFKFDLN